ncbi:MAG: hypothetical protein ABL957_15600, partial [Parvularculaceae bacterium]
SRPTMRRVHPLADKRGVGPNGPALVSAAVVALASVGAARAGGDDTESAATPPKTRIRAEAPVAPHEAQPAGDASSEKSGGGLSADADAPGESTPAETEGSELQAASPTDGDAVPAPQNEPAAAAETQPRSTAPAFTPAPVAEERSPPSQAPDRTPLVDLSMLETDDLRLLYFHPAETYLTPYVAASFDNALAFNRRLFNWEPWEKTTVLLKDFSDFGNAAARSSPNNALLLDIAPLSLAYETFSPGERFFTLTNHETTHVATMDVWNRSDARWRRVFGGKPMPVQEHPESILYSFLTTPRVSVPRWYLEGSAVFMETWMAGGFGRAQGAYDEMVFRAMVRDDAHFYGPVGLESEGVAVDFQVGVNDYLYGTRFFSYLANAYSPEKVVEWMGRGPESAPYYLTQFKRVFGESLSDVWDDWIDWERAFQQENLAALRAYPETPIEPLAQKGLGSVSRSFIDPGSGDIIGAFRYPGVLAHVGVLSAQTGKIRKLTDIDGAMLYRVTSLAYDPQSGTAWYTTDNYAFRDIVEIDVRTGRKRTVLRDARIGDLVFNPADRSLWGVRHLNGFATLVRLPAPYDSWNQIRTFDFGRVPFDLDISHDGRLLSASVGEIDGKQSVQVFEIAALATQNAEPVASFDLGSSTPEGFVFSPDGRYLFGSAYYTGVSNIYRYDLAGGAIEAVSNASTGFFRPIPREDGSLVVFDYSGDGLRPGVIDPAPLSDLGAIKFLGAEIAARHPVVKTWTAGAPDVEASGQREAERKKYIPRDELQLGAAYPVVEGYLGAVAFGYHVVFEDPLQFNQIKATVSYSPESAGAEENWHVDLEYKALKWRIRYWHNDADFYDLFGPTERARAGDAVIAGYRHSFVYDPPRKLELSVEVGHYMGLDRLPAAQEVVTQFSSLTSFNAELQFEDTARSLGAVDHEKGVRWNVALGADYAGSKVYPSARIGFDIGAPLPIRNSSVWLYTSAGATAGSSASPLGSSYFGAFGNNYVDDREIKRYREPHSLPGFEINEISARRFVKAIAEWNLPPVRFEDVGAPGLFLSSARPAVFAGVLAADPAAGSMKTYQTIGAQLDWFFTAAHRLPMVFSVGYAEGFENGDRKGGEVLLSLKIM